MNEIDSMDMLGCLHLRAWNAKKTKDKEKPKQSTIDQVWPGLKP